jgi:rubrerythrin
MTMRYNAGEIYAIGVEIEKNGREFYARAADREKDPDRKRMLADLSAWENGHVRLFESLRAQVAGDNSHDPLFDPERDGMRYLKAIADSHVFLQSRNVSVLFSSCTDTAELLHVALRFEKDSVALYAALANVVPESLGKKDVELLRDEEIAHVYTITRMIDALGDT